jgi:hypothetical protein
MVGAGLGAGKEVLSQALSSYQTSPQSSLHSYNVGQHLTSPGLDTAPMIQLHLPPTCSPTVTNPSSYVFTCPHMCTFVCVYVLNLHLAAQAPRPGRQG